MALILEYPINRWSTDSRSSKQKVKLFSPVQLFLRRLSTVRTLPLMTSLVKNFTWQWGSDRPQSDESSILNTAIPQKAIYRLNGKTFGLCPPPLDTVCSITEVNIRGRVFKQRNYIPVQACTSLYSFQNFIPLPPLKPQQSFTLRSLHWTLSQIIKNKVQNDTCPFQDISPPTDSLPIPNGIHHSTLKDVPCRQNAALPVRERFEAHTFLKWSPP